MEPEDNKQGAPTPPEDGSPKKEEEQAPSPSDSSAGDLTAPEGAGPEQTPEVPAEQDDSGGKSAADDSAKSEESAPEEPAAGAPDQATGDKETSEDQLYDPYDDYGDDPYAYEGSAEEAAAEQKAVTKAETPPPPPTPPKKQEVEDEDDADEDGMLRMSFMDHLEELRSRLIRSLMGIGVAFFASIVFANQLWLVVSEPAMDALRTLGVDPPQLVQIKPMETFTTVWVKLPMLTAIFLASPWVLYQVWAFIAPGLYKRERHWAAPFVICSAGLFILGGMFAYFVAFRFGLTFLLGIGRDINIAPFVSITEYFNLFVNVTLGIGLVFELPILIFFLTLLRIVTPGFLVRNSRYAVLIIVVLAAIITPTPDVVNLTLFSVPMCLLYFVGIFAGYLLNLHRDRQRFPWRIILLILILLVVIVSVALYLAVTRYGFQIQTTWPYLIR